MLSEPVTFVVPVNDEELYKNNFLVSPLFSRDFPHQILIQRNFPSAAKAYNSAIDHASNDLIVFAHQDIVLPWLWLDDLKKSLDYLKETDPLWGVLGCIGVTKKYDKWAASLYCTSNMRKYPPFEYPTPVQTLDEIVLILRRSSGLRFDDNLPHFHFYGTDICMAAASRGRTCYAIPAFCLHNSNKIGLFPKEFFESCDCIRKHWKHFLPIYTTCVIITRSTVAFYLKYKYERQLRYFLLKMLGKKIRYNTRVNEPLVLLEKIGVNPTDCTRYDRGLDRISTR